MFCECANFDQNIENWDVSNVHKINIRDIFRGCVLFLLNQNISEWIIKNPDLESEISNNFPTLLTNYRTYILK
jgi:hypothetical protein